ncbi:DUF7563 family protein [Halopelagius longus]|uniref:Small CPxCG-related zinc finger protein n=1 Tax=Halopelagius longus TaxID=1236180 RepID=A0A1H1DDN0_9EURY|nr:hypothetical protein [Halopelagius longus]SDQ74328.1 hypothetical protein SAMN05216278_2351 [Halopelagius longus]
MYTCNNCDEFVTRDFVRVFGDEDGRVFGCPSCATTADLHAGAASSPAPSAGPPSP